MLTNPSLPMIKKLTFPFLCYMIFPCCFVFRLAADDAVPLENIMEIVSETTNYSAKIARNKNATEKEKKKDKERKRIGIGEEVTVTLTSKKAILLEPKDEIQWKVKKGEELLMGGLTSEKETPETAIFQVSPYASKEQIQQAGGLVIEVETQQGISLPEPIEFEVVFPEQLTAEHETFGGIIQGVSLPGCPENGSDVPGASAALNVSIHPLDVCYAGIWIIEKDEGFEGLVGSLAEKHDADSNCAVTKENRFEKTDNIRSTIPRKDLNEIKGIDDQGRPIYRHSYPNEFTWKCLFRTFKSPDMKGISDIATVYQRFHINRRPNDQFYTRIKKFFVDPQKKDECSVERTTGGNHIFKP